MVEPLDNDNQNDSLGMEGIEVQLADYDDVKHPKAIASEDQGQKAESGQVKKDEEETKKRIGGYQRNEDDPPHEPNMFEKACPYLSVRPLAPYFNVETALIRKRMIGSLIPFRYNNFYQTYSEQPDLYGPFWILTTIIITIFIAGNIERYAATEEVEDFEYNFKLIPIAAMVMYGVGIGLPLLLKFVLNLYGTAVDEPTTPLITSVGIYGYSFSSFVFTTLICAIPIDWLQWIAIAYSAIASGSFLIRMYWEDFKKNLDGKLRWIAILLLCTVQLALLLIFKLYFFKHVKGT